MAKRRLSFKFKHLCVTTLSQSDHTPAAESALNPPAVRIKSLMSLNIHGATTGPHANMTPREMKAFLLSLLDFEHSSKGSTQKP